MTTAIEYRQYARECMQSAREARTDEIRKEFLSIAKLWLTAAERLDARSERLTKLDGHASAEIGVVGPNEPS